jgi:hypothetical protein
MFNTERVAKIKNNLVAKSKSKNLLRLRSLKAHRVHDTMALSVFKKKTLWRQQNYKFPLLKGKLEQKLEIGSIFKEARNNLVLFLFNKAVKK